MRLKIHCALASIRRASFFCVFGTLVLGFAVHFGCVPAPSSGTSDDPRDTLGGGIDDDPSDDVISTAGSLYFEARPSFCCDPLKIEFDAVLGPDVPLAGVTFRWKLGDGRTATGPHVVHTYPWAGNYEIQLTAELPLGPSLINTSILSLSIDGSGTTGITVTPGPDEDNPNDPNEADTGFNADAGQDQSVISGDVVTLNGSNSHGNHDLMKYSWYQTSGTPVELSAYDKPIVTFTAPMLAAPDLLTFVLVISQEPLEDSDQVTILVDPFLAPANGETTPVVLDQSFTVSSMQPVVITLSGTDPDNDNLTFYIADEPTKGTLGPIDNSGLDSASVTYIPDPGYDGTDVFSFVATDGQSESNVGTISLNVLANGRPPEVQNSVWLGQVGRAIRIPLVGTDEDGDSLTFVIDTPPTGGSLGPMILDTPQSSFIDFVPNPGFEGTTTLEFHAADQLYESATATITIRVDKALLPWHEVNAPANQALEFYTPSEGAEPGMTIFDFAMVGLDNWSQVTNQAIITTIIQNVDDLYPNLMTHRPPGMRIIGGFKPTNIPGAVPFDPDIYNFADHTAWQEVAVAAQHVVDHTGINIVVLENEAVLEPFHLNMATIDYDAMYDALAPLRESGIEYWWWLPNVLHDWEMFPDRLAQSTALTIAVRDAVPNSKFMVAYAAWNDWNPPTDGPERQAMIDTVGLDKMQDELFVTPDGWWHYTTEPWRRCYTAAEALNPTAPFPGDTRRVYPGADWIRVSEDFTEVLPPLGIILPD